MNKVTVYITNFNYGRFLPLAIDSVINQSYPNIELILVDDGSTDDSLKIIRELQSKTDITLIQNERKGLIYGCNNALEIASGDFIVRLDADDFFELNAIELMVQEFNSDAELDLVFPDYYVVNTEGERISERRRHDFAKVTLKDLPAHGACTMVKTTTLKEIGGYSTLFDRQDGYYLWLKIGLSGRVKNIQKPLFSYRRHGLNLTSNQSELLSVRRKIKRFCVGDSVLKNTTVIMPLRSWKINKYYYVNVKDKSGTYIVLEYLDKFIKSSLVSEVFIIVDSNKNYIDSELFEALKCIPSVHIIVRPPFYESLDQDLMRTIREFPENIKSIFSRNICVASYEQPFVSTELINEHIDTLHLFSAEVVIGVTEMSKGRWRHNGHSLVRHSESVTLEWEDEFIHAGGLIAFSKTWFEKEKTIDNSIVSHVLVENWRNVRLNSSAVLESYGYDF